MRFFRSREIQQPTLYSEKVVDLSDSGLCRLAFHGISMSAIILLPKALLEYVDASFNRITTLEGFKVSSKYGSPLSRGGGGGGGEVMGG